MKQALIRNNTKPNKTNTKIGQENEAYDCSNDDGVIGFGQCGVSKAKFKTKNERKHPLFMGRIVPFSVFNSFLDLKKISGTGENHIKIETIKPRGTKHLDANNVIRSNQCLCR